MNDTQPMQAIAKCETTAPTKAATDESLHVVAGTFLADKIRDLAHQKWEAAGFPDESAGRNFWLEAERELAAQSTADDAQPQPTPGENDDTIGF